MINNRLKNIKMLKYCWVFLAFYFLNICVDAPDPTINFTKDLNEYNDQESIVEIVLEKVLNLNNIIEENENTDTEEHTSQKVKTIDLFLSETNQPKFSFNLPDAKKIKFPIYTPKVLKKHFKVELPPPNYC